MTYLMIIAICLCVITCAIVGVVVAALIIMQKLSKEGLKVVKHANHLFRPQGPISRIDRKIEKNEAKILGLIEFASAGMDLWKHWKKGGRV